MRVEMFADGWMDVEQLERRIYMCFPFARLTDHSREKENLILSKWGRQSSFPTIRHFYLHLFPQTIPKGITNLYPPRQVTINKSNDQNTK